MPIIQWEQKYETGIRQFDEHHQKLVELINKLYDAMRAGKGNDVLAPVFEELIAYTQYHFAAEEKAFKASGYIAAVSHTREHNNLVKKVTELKADFDAGKMGITTQTMGFLRDWLLNHIQKSDKMYVTHLKKHGIA
jgi:hemerythrin